MITYIEGNLFTSTAQTLVNTVNTAGVMGKGIAKEFKTYFPGMVPEYVQRCKDGSFAHGQLLLYRTPHKWVLNFPTKRHWRNPSRLEDIEAGLATFVRTYAEQGISSIVFPQLGCGNGGLDWEGQVRPLMERYLGDLFLDVQIIIPGRGAADDVPDEQQIKEWLKGDGQIAGFAAFRADVDGIAGLDRVDDDALWELWRQLRHEGVVLPEDLGEPGDPSVLAMIHGLATLPYLRETRAVRIYSAMAYDAPTQALFEKAEARGVRFIPPLFQAVHAAPEPLTVELGPACNVNPTQTQLALSLTN
ncbi:MAG: macro domain-containing protein [Thermomicrobiales bacterium]